MVLLLVFMQLTRDLFAIAKFLSISGVPRNCRSVHDGSARNEFGRVVPLLLQNGLSGIRPTDIFETALDALIVLFSVMLIG